MSRIVLLSNITTEILEQNLKKKGYEVCVPAGFNTWIQEILDDESFIYKGGYDAVFLLLYGDSEAEKWVSYEDGTSEMERWLHVIDKLAGITIPVFISDLDIPVRIIRPASERRPEFMWEYEWYDKLQKLCESRDNLYVFDIKSLIEDTGRKEFYSSKMWYIGNMPYSLKGIKILSEEMENLVNAAKGVRKKCIALDLDNTIWGGVAGEDGMEGICLDRFKEGKCYFDFQKRLKEIKESGGLLAVISKNNPEDAEKIINEHPDMVLHDDDFVIKKINWDMKTQNMESIAEELNIGVDSIVFVDDNPAEQELVRKQLDSVVVCDYPKDPSYLNIFAGDIYRKYFLALRLTGEDRVKTEMYHQEDARKKIIKNALSPEEYIGTLELEADIHIMRPDEINRTAQLCNKTNQFNVTTKRYGAGDLESFVNSDNYAVYTAGMKDRFGDYGQIAVLILHFSENRIEIDTFLMSCRVMGRFLENVMFGYVIQQYKENYRYVHAIYKATTKNKPVDRLFDKLGMNVVNEDKEKRKYQMESASVLMDDFGYKSIIVNNMEQIR